MKTLRQFTYPGDRKSAGGGWEVAMTARTGCWRAMFRESGKSLHGKTCPLKLKGAD